MSEPGSKHDIPAFEPITPSAELLSRRVVDVESEPEFSTLLEMYPVLRRVRVEELTYLSEGIEVRAFLVVAANARAAPSVVYARGGGAANKVTPFIIGLHLAPLAEAGYCVVATQYRTEPNGRDEFGGAELADLVNVVSVLEQLPEADADRVGLLGWSRGAMMVHLALAHAPSAFRAAVCAAGVVDQFAELERRPAMETVLARQIPDFEANRDRELARRSPLLWADRLPRDVPLLLLHGASDWRVSAQEPLKLAPRLQELSIPYRLIIYEGADHGIREHKAEVTEQIRAWFDRYLRPGASLPNLEPHGR